MEVKHIAINVSKNLTTITSHDFDIFILSFVNHLILLQIYYKTLYSGLTKHYFTQNTTRKFFYNHYIINIHFSKLINF